jgi:levanase/fructan beta-fructosidase
MKKFLIAIATLILSNNLIAQKQIPTPQWRPLYHFTPLKNWTNDPNGLLYLNGVYHLYNQQNPYENNWGHMSWGHATSTDLVHWKHHGIALPEQINGDDTTWRFSGSAVWDKKNSSGFCKGDSGCLVAIYTADQPHSKKESQYIAYSNNGGMTFTDYKNNPVIDLHKKDFRDPNVQWDASLKKWLMVVAFPRENSVQFYSSPDLKKWNLLSEFGNAGLKNGIWECPFFIQLPVEGSGGKTKWVLVNSFQDSHGNEIEEYYVGNFDGKTFTSDNPADKVLLVDHGDALYAAIQWNNLPAGQHTYIGWMVPQDKQETYPWRGQMSIPRDISLRETKDGIRLVQNPAKVIKENLSSLSNQTLQFQNLNVEGDNQNIFKEKKIHGNSYWLNAEIEVPDNAIAGFKIGSGKDKNENTFYETVIGYDASKHEVFVDRTHSGGNINPDKRIQTMHVDENNGKIKFEILFDKSSLEIFVNDGEETLTTYIYPPENADGISVFSKGGKSVITSLKIWDMTK